MLMRKGYKTIQFYYPKHYELELLFDLKSDFNQQEIIIISWFYGNESILSSLKWTFYQIDCTEFEDDDLDYYVLNNLRTYMKRYHKFLRPVLISDSYYIEKSDSNVKDFLNKIDRKANPY